jgi:hypothetical protein
MAKNLPACQSAGRRRRTWSRTGSGGAPPPSAAAAMTPPARPSHTAAAAPAAHSLHSAADGRCFLQHQRQAQTSNLLVFPPRKAQAPQGNTPMKDKQLLHAGKGEYGSHLHDGAADEARSWRSTCSTLAPFRLAMRSCMGGPYERLSHGPYTLHTMSNPSRGRLFQVSSAAARAQVECSSRG